MVKQGTVFNNTISGINMEFLETNESSQGRFSKIKLTVKPDSLRTPAHIHQTQDEHFEVLQGTYTYEINGEKKHLKAGEWFVLPKAVAHNHYNEGTEDCIVIQTITPALDFEDIMQRLNELAAAGKTPNGDPPLMEVMIMLQKHQSRTYLAGMPVGVQQALSAVLAPVGRMLGYGKN